VQGLTNDKDSNRSVTYTYDALNRILSATTPNSDCTVLPSGITKNWGESFTIDPWGNLKTITVTKCSAESLSVSPLSNNQLSGFNYDADGNMTSNGGASYSYDGENRLKTTAGVTYTYDGDGNRVEKSSGTLYWGAGPMLESDLSGNFQREFIFAGGKRVARRDISGGAVYYYFTDHLGSSDVVTNSSGAIQNESDYFPYGGERVYSQTLASQNYKFTGKERDAESGLDNFGARYNASMMGRFMTPDPLMASAHASNPQTWNRYAYALNNPLRFVDPDGMKACTDKDKCVDVKVNVIYDQNANKGKGLTQQQKDQIQKQILAKAQDQFGTSKIKLDLSFTGGKINVDSQGNASFSGLQKGALNLLFTNGAPYAATQGDAGASSKASGMYLTVVDTGHSEFDEKETVPHELAHQFLGDPDRTPNKDALIDAGFHIYREADIGVRNFFQRQGVSQTDYQQGARTFSPPQTQENITPKQ